MINLLLLVYCETFFVIINVDKKFMHSDMLLKKSALIFQNNFLKSNSC